jgi:hypothetical protein
MEADAAETFDACRSKWRASRRIDTTPGKSSSGDLRSPISCAVWLISRARPANRRRQCRSMSPAASTRHSRAHGAPRAHRRRDAYRLSVRSVLLTPPGWPRSRRVTEGKGHLFTIETEMFLCPSVTTSNHLAVLRVEIRAAHEAGAGAMERGVEHPIAARPSDRGQGATAMRSSRQEMPRRSR